MSQVTAMCCVVQAWKLDYCKSSFFSIVLLPRVKNKAHTQVGKAGALGGLICPSIVPSQRGNS